MSKATKSNRLTKAERLKVKEVEAALAGHFCFFALWVDRDGVEGVSCDRPAWQRSWSGFLCPHHAAVDKTVKATLAEDARNEKRFAGCKTRAEALAVRTGGGMTKEERRRIREVEAALAGQR